MKVNFANTNIYFSSKNCPVQPFVVRSSVGPLTVSEASNNDIKKMSTEFLNMERKKIKPPNPDLEFLLTLPKECEEKSAYIERVKNFEIFKSLDLKSWRNDIVKHFNRIKNKRDKNSTVLVIKDYQKKVRGIAIMESFDVLKSSGIRDSKTAIIHFPFIHKQNYDWDIYFGVIKNLLPAAQGHFNDVLIANKYSLGTYVEHLGFKDIDRTNPHINEINKCLGKDLNIFYAKNLVAGTPWWERVVKVIK